MMTAANAQKPSFHARVAAATVADVLRIPPATVGQHDHVAAAAYLMKHAGTTALLVTDAQTGQPAGVITQADVARAIADGKDVNAVWVEAVMTIKTCGSRSLTAGFPGVVGSPEVNADV